MQMQSSASDAHRKLVRKCLRLLPIRLGNSRVHTLLRFSELPVGLSTGFHSSELPLFTPFYQRSSLPVPLSPNP